MWGDPTRSFSPLKWSAFPRCDTSQWHHLGKRHKTDAVSPPSSQGQYWTSQKGPCMCWVGYVGMKYSVCGSLVKHLSSMIKRPWAGGEHTLYTEELKISSLQMDKESTACLIGGKHYPLLTGIALLGSSPHINWIFIVMFRADASLLAKFSLCG